MNIYESTGRVYTCISMYTHMCTVGGTGHGISPWYIYGPWYLHTAVNIEIPIYWTGNISPLNNIQFNGSTTGISTEAVYI